MRGERAATAACGGRARHAAGEPRGWQRGWGLPEMEPMETATPMESSNQATDMRLLVEGSALMVAAGQAGRGWWEEAGDALAPAGHWGHALLPAAGVLTLGPAGSGRGRETAEGEACRWHGAGGWWGGMQSGGPAAAAADGRAAWRVGSLPRHPAPPYNPASPAAHPAAAVAQRGLAVAAWRRACTGRVGRSFTGTKEAFYIGAADFGWKRRVH